MAPSCTSSDGEFLRHAKLVEQILQFCHAAREAGWVDYNEKACAEQLKDRMVSYD